MRNRITILLISTLFITVSAFAQLTVEQCYEKARKNYPLIKQYGLISESEGYNIKNVSKGWLPQFSISARATYQTDVTKLPISVPGIKVPTLDKDQYQVIAEMSQMIWDGGIIRAGKDGIKAKHEAGRARYEVDMYAINGRINDLFFGILLIEEQLSVNDIFIDNLRISHDKVVSYVANGVANVADLDAVRVEQLGAGQKRTELVALRKAYFQMLSAMIGEQVEGCESLVKPDAMLNYAKTYEGDFSENLRPELKLFDALNNQMKAQRRNISASNLPKIAAFVQGGYGNPGLNMLKKGFEPYAIGGVRLTWNFGGLYTRKNDLNNIDRSVRDIEVQRETFLFNNSLQVTRQRAELEKYRAILADDDNIISMRVNIRRASEAKVDSGTMTVTDLMRDMNAEQSAMINKTLHEVEMLKAMYDIKNLINN